MNTIAERLKHARELAGLTQPELAAKAKVSQGTIGNIETGLRKRPRDLLSIAAALSVTPVWLETGKGQMQSSVIDLLTSDVGEPVALKGMRRLPVVGEVKGGDDGYLDEYQYPVGFGDGYIEYPTTDPNAYALRVRGDSMHPRYRAGEFVVIEPSIEAQDSDDVIVICSNGKKMLKQLNWRRDGEIQLLSLNSGYGPLTIPLSEIESIQLVAGRARRNALQIP